MCASPRSGGRVTAAEGVDLAELWEPPVLLTFCQDVPPELVNSSPTFGASFISHPSSPCIFFASNCKLLGVPGPTWLCLWPCTGPPSSWQAPGVAVLRSVLTHRDKLLPPWFCFYCIVFTFVLFLFHLSFINFESRDCLIGFWSSEPSTELSMFKTWVLSEYLLQWVPEINHPTLSIFSFLL